VRLLTAGRLDNEWHIRQCGMLEQFPHWRSADLPGADVRVPVPTRSAARRRVVGVYELHPPRPSRPHERVQHGRWSAGRRQVVSGGEEMTGVHAHAGFGVPAEHVQVRLEVADVGAEHLPLPRHRLQQHVGSVVTELVEQREQATGDPPQRGVAVGANGGPRVDDDAAGTDLRTAAECVRERGDRTRRRELVRRAQIDQIRRVHEYWQAGFRGMPPQRLVLCRVARGRRPAARVGGEHLDHFGADRSGICQPGGREAPGDGRVRPDPGAPGLGFLRWLQRHECLAQKPT
jgi:hypothetical protein